MFRFLRPYALALAAAAALSACASQSSCVEADRRELRTIDRLISDTRTNIARGYRNERVDSGANVNFCLGGRQSHVGVSFCTDPGIRTQAVALDTEAETRKLEALLARRDILLQTIAARQASCAAGDRPA